MAANTGTTGNAYSPPPARTISIESDASRDNSSRALPMTNQPWFHGPLSRPDAEQRLKQLDMRDGLFLVRESPRSPGSIVLSVCFAQKMHNFQISEKLSGNGRQLHIDDGPLFSTLDDLIGFYRSGIDGLPIQLKTHCPNKSIASPPKKIGSYEVVWLATENEKKDEKSAGQQLAAELEALTIEDGEVAVERQKLLSRMRRSKKAIHTAVNKEEESKPFDPDSKTKVSDQRHKSVRVSQSAEEKVYLLWMNNHLTSDGISLQNLQEDIKTARPVIRVIEILSGKAPPVHALNPFTPVQVIDNWHVVLQFMRRVGISVEGLDANELCHLEQRALLKLFALLLKWEAEKKPSKQDAGSSAT
ncbi:tyrosine-protein kinase Shark-like [Corticium candelabrum]|uniref:tyrosine-protein kinase Shark-like n=1 Tax=Corticium candelabrum TaxID=121492 RepID=UPI002E25231E|nr:tyrosine-protein kinase Shark-like [Corticium candelabrum]